MRDLRRYVKYLCLQATREGQASHAHVHEIIGGLAQRGWEVELFEPPFARTESCPGPIGRLWGFAHAQARLLLRRRRPCVLYIRAHFAAFLVALVARLSHIQVVQEVNGPYDDLFIAWPWTRRFGALFRWLQRAQLEWADAIIVVTPGLRDWVLREVGDHPVYVIPNGANVELFRPEASHECPIEGPYAVFCGALAPWQGVDTMIKAVEMVEWPAKLQLVVVGDGAERDKLQDAAERNPKLVLLGRIPYRSVPGIIANSVTSLSPKSSLGDRSSTGLFPLKLFEAMACGVPIVLTDFPGQADLVREHDCGLVIPPGDHEALASAVAYLYGNPDVRASMGQRARKAMENQHSWDRRAADTESVLLSVMNGVTCADPLRK